MKKIYITADAELNLLDYEQPKVSLGDTVILELSSNVNNEYSIRVDFNFDNENVEYLRPMTLIDTNLWNYTIPIPVLQAVSSKNEAVTLETYITAYNIINNTINQNYGFTNKIGLFTTPSDLPLEDVEVGVDYAIVAYENDGITVNDNIWQYTSEGWIDSELKEKLTSVATTTINIALDKFVQNSQELIDTTITDQILEEISNINNNINIGELESKAITIYDSDFSYSLNAVTHDGDSFYKSLKNNNIGNALTDTLSWDKLEAATIADIEELISEHNVNVNSHPSLVKITDIVDNLTSTDTDKPLSANQGNIVGEKITTLENLMDQNIKAWDGSIATSFAGGTGTEEDPYLISDGSELAYLAQLSITSSTLNKYYELTNDIVLNKNSYLYENWGTIAPENIWIPIGNDDFEFRGNFDGRNFKIYGIYLKNSNDWQGLFGYCYGSTIQNVGIINGYIDCRGMVGGIAGYTRGIVKNCYNSGIVKGFGIVGGIVGDFGTIINCYNTGSVSGYTSIGGIVGVADIVLNCYNTGSVSGTYTNIGGITGTTSEIVKNCYNSGNVIGNGSIGGIIGDNSGELINCYNIGSINNMGIYTGSIAGRNYSNGQILYSYYIAETIPVGLQEGTISNLSSFDINDQILDTPVTVDGVEYNDLTSALNVWVNYNQDSTTSYLTWVKQSGAVNDRLPILTKNSFFINEIEYGNSIEMSYEATTGVLSLDLKNKAGITLSSDSVDLPLELLIDSGTVKTCIVDDEPVAGYIVGDKYIDLVLANESHIYILVTDLIDQITITETGTGNAVTDISINGSVLTETKGKTFEETSNKTTTINSSSTNIQYPSAKSIYDLSITKEPLLPVTPSEPETKFLNGNRLWSELKNSFGGFSAGYSASAKFGGAIGYGALTTDGFAGGAGAIAGIGDPGSGYVAIDAIQLGAGQNEVVGSLQIYGNQLLDASGKIPDARLNSTIIKGNTQYGGTITDNLDTLAKSGFYTCYSTAIGVPNSTYSWFVLHENSNAGTISAKQTSTAYNGEIMTYERVKTSSTWGDWVKITTAQDTKTYTTTLPTTSGGSDWQAVTGGYELAKTISGLTIYDSIVSVADDDTIWTTNALNATITTDTLTFFVSSLPSAEVVLTLTITKSTNGGTI